MHCPVPMMRAKFRTTFSSVLHSTSSNWQARMLSIARKSRCAAGVDESAESALRDGGNGNGSGSQPHPRKPDKQENTHDAEHPYKGHRIDFSL